MGESRKVTFILHYPVEKKSLSFIYEVKKKVKEVRKNNPELNKFELADVGICRMVDGVRVILYFSQKEELETGRR
ncbi:MAG: hypothetical protein ACOYI2_03060 [Bacillota bacterium]|jgi:hypothetical protein|nr:hypothetical protein [Clostridia bacterium]